MGAGTLYLLRLFRKSSGAVTPVMQGTEISRQVEKTDFQSLGLAQPITQTMTTYVLGDDLYDESFSIDTGGGEFLGEYGVGVSETIGVGEPKKVAALEIWLFDKNDIKTATKVLMTEHAYNDPNIRARLEPKGELVVVKPQEQVLLETATLQLLATVVDMEYGTGAMPSAQSLRTHHARTRRLAPQRTVNQLGIKRDRHPGLFLLMLEYNGHKGICFKPQCSSCTSCLSHSIFKILNSNLAARRFCLDYVSHFVSHQSSTNGRLDSRFFHYAGRLPWRQPCNTFRGRSSLPGL